MLKPTAAPVGAAITLFILFSTPLRAQEAATLGGEAVDERSVTGGARTPGGTFPEATPEAVVAVTQRIFPAVVRLDVAQEVYQQGRRSVVRGLGSGVIIDAEGRILTNYHVAGRAVEIYITLSNKERVPAKLIGDDHWTDLAIVQMDMEAVKKRGITFSHADLGDSSTLVPGQDVMAIGTPFGLSRTLTLGVISNTERTFYPQRQKIDDYETGEFSNWIQMDTPIAPGNSGGPLVDMNGLVVGINTRGIQGQNLNFAIPINTARDVIAAILATASPEARGKVHRAYLGLDLKPMQDLESFYATDINEGVLINSVDRNSPAQKAGALPQDVLLAIGDEPVNVRFPEEIAAARKRIADLPIGAEVQLTVKRGGEKRQLIARTVKLEGAVGEEKGFKAWGLSVRDITRAYANDRLLDDDLGVVVTTLSPGLAAAKAEVQVGDVIRAVNQQPVEDLEAFSRLYESSIETGQQRLLLELQRGRGRRSAVLRIDPAPEKPEDPPPVQIRQDEPATQPIP